ncbi:MAG: ABC transporter substrate-binding protein [Acidimicrobiia bacterium]
MRRGAIASLTLTLALGVTLALGATAAVASAARASKLPRCPIGALKTAKKPVEIVMWHQLTGGNDAVLQSIADRFNASQHDVHVTLVQFPDTAFVKFISGLKTGDLPDVIAIEETTIQPMIDTGATLPVQSCVDASRYSLKDFIPRPIAAYTTQGVLRSMPFNVSGAVLYYSKTMFQKAGLDPNRPPRSLADVEAYSKKIVAAGVAPHGIAMHREPFYNEFFYAKSGQTYVNNGNGRKSRATKATLSNATGRKIWSWWKRMTDSGLALDTGTAPTNFDHLFAVANGKAAMTITGSAATGPIFAALNAGQYPAVVPGVGPMPGLDPRGGVEVGEGSLWMSNRSSAAKQAAAWRWIQYLVSTPTLVDLDARTGYTPIRRSVVNDPRIQALWKEHPEYRVPYDQLVNGPTNAATSGAVIGPFPEVRTAVQEGLTEMIDGHKSAATALADTQKKVDSLIADYNSRVAG